MSYTAITSAEIATGEPTSSNLFTKIKDDLIDHESRLQSVETATSNAPPILFELYGPTDYQTAPLTNLLQERVTFNMTLTGATLQVITAGTSGTTQVDVQYKRGAGSFTTIFSTQPSVAFGAGDLGLSTNAVFSFTDLQAGDNLRLDLSSSQSGGVSLRLQLFYTPV